MNTDASSKPSGRVLEGPKKVLTAEQKERKNELARALRAKKRFEKQVMRGSSPSAEIEEEDAEDTDDTEDTPVTRVTRVTPVTQVTQVTPVTEDPEITRKKEIAEKRRASLALARSKIKPKSQITKEKNEEIEKMREENERLREEAEKAKQVVPMKPKVIKKYIREKPKYPERQEREITPQKQREPNSINYLAEQSYAEQLQLKLRENMLNRVMYDTFM
jgi:hypothetical protein